MKSKKNNIEIQQPESEIKIKPKKVLTETQLQKLALTREKAKLKRQELKELKQKEEQIKLEAKKRQMEKIANIIFYSDFNPNDPSNFESILKK